MNDLAEQARRLDAADPLAHLSLSMDAMAVADGWVAELVQDHAEGRWVSLGGGGYELVDVVPRAWTHLIGVVTGRPVGLSTPVPQAWLQHVQDVKEAHQGELLGLADVDARINRLAELNVMEQVRNIARTTIVQDAWRRDQPLELHGWIYGLEDGLIQDLGVSLRA